MALKLPFTILLICVGTFFFAQEKDDLKFKSDHKVVDKKNNMITFTGHVDFASPFITLNEAEKVIYDVNSGEMKIFNPKNYKLIQVNEIEKTGEKKDYLIFNIKQSKLIL